MILVGDTVVLIELDNVAVELLLSHPGIAMTHFEIQDKRRNEHAACITVLSGLDDVLGLVDRRVEMGIECSSTLLMYILNPSPERSREIAARKLCSVTFCGYEYIKHIGGLT